MSRTAASLLIVALLAGCSTLPRDGPSGRNVVQGSSTPERTGDYALVDAFARYPLTEQLSATLNLNNLLDEEYYTSTSSSYYGAPRNATLGLRMDF